MNRRHLLQLAAGAAATAALPLPAVAARSARTTLTVTELGERLFMVSGGGGNVTVFALGNAGTRIIAHENTKLWLGVDVDSKWENRFYKRQPAKARPNQTFYMPQTLQFGGETLDCALLPEAHTDGDIYVFFRKANVLVAGDVVSPGAYPVLDIASNGWITGNINGCTTLKDLAKPDTRIVPGRGGVQALAQLDAQTTMLTAVRQRMARMLVQGKSAQEMIDAKPTAEFDAVWGDPQLFIRNAFRGISLRPQTLGLSVV